MITATQAPEKYLEIFDQFGSRATLPAALARVAAAGRLRAFLRNRISHYT